MTSTSSRRGACTTSPRRLSSPRPPLPTPNERQLLFLRLFGEYVNALEVLGGWGWATRYRKEFKLLLDAFLGYVPGEVTSFYETIADGGDLASLLALRPLPEIARAWVERADEPVRERDLLDEFFVLAPQRDPTQSGRYLFSKFRADDAMFARVTDNVAFVSRTTRAVVSLLRNLKALGLL